jgi:hypothetical protein
MPQPTSRNKTRKRRTQRRSPNRIQDVQAASRTHVNRNSKSLRSNEGRSGVSEMPEEQAHSRRARSGEDRAVIVSPTGTKHRPIKKKMPRVAKSRAKSPSVGRQKQGRTAKSHRAQSGRTEQRAGIGRRSS